MLLGKSFDIDGFFKPRFFSSWIKLTGGITVVILHIHSVSILRFQQPRGQFPIASYKVVALSMHNLYSIKQNDRISEKLKPRRNSTQIT